MENSSYRWPEGALVYHIYPRSFMDSNGDGIGDLQGIESKLDYVQSLGVTAIWLSPTQPSPMADFGYDVSDYCDIDPIFGSLKDFKSLLHTAHEKGLKIIMDLVPNHTSDEHQWFAQSRQGPSNEYSDWYIWRDGITDPDSGSLKAPNNWRDALTGGPAWQWDNARKQYYLHSFDTRQPDLNWSNPKVRLAIKDVMRFWLDLGVDGFRVDAVYWMAKDPLLSDDTWNSEYVEGEDLLYDAVQHDNSRGWPAVYAYLSEMADVLHEPAYTERQRFMVTEAYPEGHNALKEYLTFYVSMDPQVAAPFNFEGLSMPWEAQAWRRFLKSFHSGLDQISPVCVASYAFGNHDQPRIATRLGPDISRGAAVLLLTLPGMVFLYYGDELGMHNVAIPPEYVHDPAAKGDPKSGLGRDPERTPMQWSAAPQAGFTAKPEAWLPVADDYAQNNVEVETADAQSTLNLYRSLGQLRARSPALRHGKITFLDLGDQRILGYTRNLDSLISAEHQAFAVIINFANEIVSVNASIILGKILITTHSRPTAATDLSASSATNNNQSITMQPYEAAVFALD